MKILFMGTPDFSIPSLNAIESEGHEIVGVVTQPDKPRGRGKHMMPSPVKRWSIEKGYKVYQPRKARDQDFIEIVDGIAPELIVTAAYGQILPKSMLDIPSYGCINVHASLLPKYRGAAPIQQAILEGETKTGITVMYMDEDMDTGDIILARKIDILPNDNSGDLHDRLAILGGEVLKESLRLFTKGRPKGIPQRHEEATYCQKIDKSMGRINWSMDISKIRNHVRAFTPWPGAYTFMDGLRLKMVEIGEMEYIKEERNTPGMVIFAEEEKGLVVSGLNGFVRLTRIQAPGKRVMDDLDFLRGNKVKTGIILE